MSLCIISYIQKNHDIEAFYLQISAVSLMEHFPLTNFIHGNLHVVSFDLVFPDLDYRETVHYDLF